jgi:hypothetical protein
VILSTSDKRSYTRHPLRMSAPVETRQNLPEDLSQANYT